MKWVKKIVQGANDLALVEFAGVVGATTDDKLGYLRRTKGGSNWKQAGAYSARAITKVDDEVRGVSADCATNNKRVMFGLTNNAADKDHDFNSIDFAIYCDQQHTRAIVYERGQKKAVIGSFASGETFQVALNDEGAVEYYKDGELAYTSANAPAFPCTWTWRFTPMASFLRTCAGSKALFRLRSERAKCSLQTS